MSAVLRHLPGVHGADFASMCVYEEVWPSCSLGAVGMRTRGDWQRRGTASAQFACDLNVLMPCGLFL